MHVLRVQWQPQLCPCYELYIYIIAMSKSDAYLQYYCGQHNADVCVCFFFIIIIYCYYVNTHTRTHTTTFGVCHAQCIVGALRMHIVYINIIVLLLCVPGDHICSLLCGLLIWMYSNISRPRDNMTKKEQLWGYTMEFPTL